MSSPDKMDSRLGMPNVSWVRSSRCIGDNGCVELGNRDGQLMIGDTTARTMPPLVFSPDASVGAKAGFLAWAGAAQLHGNRL